MVSPASVRARSRARPRGFALIDAIVAVILMGVSLSVIIGLVGSAVGSQRTGERIATAAMLADERLSLILARGVESALGSSGTTEGACQAPFADFRYRVSVSGGRSAGETYTVDVDIAWDEPAGPKSVSVRALIAPRDGDEVNPDRRPQTTPERPQ
ncbi:MAG: hypothetical protein C0475_05335 [Planctomyces sp.]|nr:hypothetical protein [Planctomyces sp.]MBA4039641.1 hypothetical protein [Planctomyces sp.]MBA4119979.1 hypothetical protein [Isosphaera sp.]